MNQVPTEPNALHAEYMRQLGKARAKSAGPAKPTVEELSGGWTLQRYQTEILPALAHVPLADIERATGLSNGGCSRIRRGLQIPNPKRWVALAALARCARNSPPPSDASGLRD